ncbi:triacylglycerol lipase [Schizosaccharomyces cryophilus OY26]|uniref:Triacylglycerol lipase n=1 Tax=Schizosaccharomyces cryophilus (strain OY26 / ATCC MYA-4695 / CBS 11777 / NBRC 106824 / NRRL Y48691) TaxID=653667 RepID=S9X141_SCHCR|nr:triacylglycerol lipase [Schizosaccharomyces cryophilus OY26]EPY50807.1 triacylglycerol lipase [Schizosaccharomyces cryophilus OY26]
MSKDELKFQMEYASTYEDWLQAAEKLDMVEGKYEWRKYPESDEYNYKLVESRLHELKKLRLAGDVRLMFGVLQNSVARDFGNLDNSQLYNYAHSGTKKLIDEFIQEVLYCLEFLEETPVLSLEEKLVEFSKLKFTVGNTALILSGGGTFGMNHIGVLKDLYEQGLIPKIICGSSAGAIVACAAGVRNSEEQKILLKQFHTGDLNVFTDPNVPPLPLWTSVKRFFTKGCVLDICHLERVMKLLIGDFTFQEAYNRSGYILNVTVSCGSSYEMPSLLNYITTPNVLIWSAVVATCSVPVLFQPATLWERDPLTREVRAFCVTDAPLWMDGSVDNDIPHSKLTELFHVNHFIVSQVNFHIVPFIMDPASHSWLERCTKKVIDLAAQEVSLTFRLLSEMGICSTLFTKLQSVITQKYSGDITILPKLNYRQVKKVIQNPTPSFLLDAMARGKRGTWKRIPVTRNHCAIEMFLEIAYARIVKKLQAEGKTKREIDMIPYRSNITHLNTRAK